MIKWQLSEQAQNDMKDIRAFTKQKWGARQSALYIRQILTKIEMLTQNPTIGIDRSSESGENTRSIFVGSHTIYYGYNEGVLTIQAVLHQAMTPEIHLFKKNN